MPVNACVFDAYGTLFDVAGAARAAAAQDEGADWVAHWPQLAADWRRKQLEYTWLRALSGTHADFWQVTADALDWALDAAELSDPALRTRLLALYRELPAYPEVPSVLAALRARSMPCAILSNGSPAMLADAIASAGIGEALSAVISVEEVGIFKPAPQVYALVERHLGLPPAQVGFVSANGWDACSAAGFGFHSIWVNREGAPMDRLAARPAQVLGDLSPLPDIIKRD